MSRINEDVPAPQSKLSAAPPPPYTEYAAGPSSSASVPFPSSNARNTQQPHTLQLPTTQAQVSLGMPMPVPHAHPEYGPTPLAADRPLLPYAYYESRGSADTRAKWRFFQAFLYAIALWVICGVVVGVELWGGEWWDLKGWMRIGGLDGVVRYWLKLRVSNGAFEFAQAV